MPYDEEGRYIYPLPVKKTRKKPGKQPSTPSSQPIIAPPIPTPELLVTPAKSVTLESISPTPVQTKPQVIKAVPENPSVEIESVKRFQLDEKALSSLWNAQTWPTGIRLKTTEGKEINVIYRGRWSYGLGPDFRGAILDIEGELYRGEVELHLTSQDWFAHNHQANPQYNSVILHIVLNPSKNETIKAEGQKPAEMCLLEVFEGNEDA